MTFQSGLPLIVTQGQNNVGLFNPTQRPTWNGNDANLSGSTNDKLAKWFDTSAFAITPAFTWGNTPRVMPNLRADGVKNFDLSLFKNNSFDGGRFNAQFRAELFNAFNHAQFNAPNGRYSASTASAFGRIFSAGSPRIAQLAVKILF